MSKLEQNLRRVQARIAAAAQRGGREAETVRLVCVTKESTLPQVQELYALGMRHFGENRVEAAAPKIAALPRDAVWHFIAPVQRRRAREVVRLFSHADALDRPEAAEALHKRCEELEKTLQVLVEVNVSGEPSKHGFSAEQFDLALPQLQAFNRLKIRGVMTMAPFSAPPDFIRQVFRQTRALAERHGFPEVSMGMSADFELAVEEGATEVRLGSVLFAED